MYDFDRLMEIQRRTASRIRQETEVDNKIKILDIMNNLSALKGKKVQVEAIILEAGMQGMSEDDTIATLDSLKRDRLVIEPEVGYVKLL